MKGNAAGQGGGMEKRRIFGLEGGRARKCPPRAVDWPASEGKRRGHRHRGKVSFLTRQGGKKGKGGKPQKVEDGGKVTELPKDFKARFNQRDKNMHTGNVL